MRSREAHFPLYFQTKLSYMTKQIVIWAFMIASLVGGIYIAYAFDSWFKLFSIILFGFFYGAFRLKITGKW